MWLPEERDGNHLCGVPILDRYIRQGSREAERRAETRDPSTALVMQGPGGPLNTPTDVIVVGGGAIGMSIAWRTAERGASVTIVDPADGKQASLVAAGMLAPVTEVHYGEEPLLRLNLASADLYPSWIAHLEEVTGCSAGYVQTGTVLVARDGDDRAALDHLLDFQRSLDLDVERLNSRQLRELEPGCASSVRGGVLVKGDHQVDPAALNAALGIACERVGVTTIRAEVKSVDIEGGAVTGVTLAGGDRISAGKVVVAAGAASGEVGGLPAGMFPVRPVKGQLVELSPGTDPCPIHHNVRGLDVYLVPRSDGRVLVGATMEERGWDAEPTAGAVHDLLRYAYELVPGITEMTFKDVHVGFRPGTPDNAPLLGPTSIEGLVAATGHFRNGMLLTPVTADSIAEMLISDELPEAIAPFSPQRFGANA